MRKPQQNISPSVRTLPSKITTHISRPSKKFFIYKLKTTLYERTLKHSSMSLPFMASILNLLSEMPIWPWLPRFQAYLPAMCPQPHLLPSPARLLPSQALSQLHIQLLSIPPGRRSQISQQSSSDVYIGISRHGAIAKR